MCNGILFGVAINIHSESYDENVKSRGRAIGKAHDVVISIVTHAMVLIANVNVSH